MAAAGNTAAAVPQFLAGVSPASAHPTAAAAAVVLLMMMLLSFSSARMFSKCAVFVVLI